MLLQINPLTSDKHTQILVHTLDKNASTSVRNINKWVTATDETVSQVTPFIRKFMILYFRYIRRLHIYVVTA